MKKRTLFFAISLCFVFCLAVLLSGKFLGEGENEESSIGYTNGQVHGMKLTLPDDFYDRISNYETIDLHGVILEFDQHYVYYVGGELYEGDDHYTFQGASELKITPSVWEFPGTLVYEVTPINYGNMTEFNKAKGRTNLIRLDYNWSIKLHRNYKEDDTDFDYCTNKEVEAVQPQTWEGYEFQGYFTDKSSGTKIFDKYGKRTDEAWPEEVSDLYAHWVPALKVTANNLNIEYDGNPKDISGCIKINDKDPENPYYLMYSYDNGATWKNTKNDPDASVTPYSNIGTYYIKYVVLKYDGGGSILPFTKIKEGDITLNIYGDKKSMFMGVSSIMGFDAKLLNYNYIWFGHHGYGDGSSADSPIKFRVLSNQTNDDYNKAGLFLLSEYTLAQEKMKSEDNLPYYSYYTSDLRNKLYDLTSSDNIFKDAFSDLEKGKILKTISIDNASPDSIVNSYEDFVTTPYIGIPGKDAQGKDIITGEDLFLISKVDLRNQNYFSVNSTFKNTWKIFGGIDREYFTSSKNDPRMHGSNFTKIDINTIAASGDLSVKPFTDKAGVRPAMNLKVEDVAFSASTAVKDAGNNVISGAKAGAVGEEVKKVEEDTQNVFDSFKLTFFDKDKLKLVCNNTDTKKIDDIKSQNVITINGVEINKCDNDLEGNPNFKNKYVSAMITKKSGEIMYYGRLLDASELEAKTGTVTLKIPYTELPNNQGADTIENGDYDIKLFLEEYNGGATDANKTDRCSDFVTIPLEVRTAIDFYQASSTEITYNGLGQTIPSPSVQIDQTYVDIQYRKKIGPGPDNWSDWSFDKPFETNVKYQTSGDPTSEVLSYEMQVKVSVKYIYKNHPLLKYYTETIKNADLKINPAPLEYNAQSVYKTYDGLPSKIEITPYVNGENYKVLYKDSNGEYSETEPEFLNVNDTATIDDNDEIESNGKIVYFKILACNYEIQEGMSTATILPVNVYMQIQNVDVPYDGAPHTFNVLNYLPSADKLSLIYSVKANGVNSQTDEKPDFTDAGEYHITIDIKEVDVDANGKKNHNYVSVATEATVIIRQANVVYQAESSETEYDGEPHTIGLFLSYPTISNAEVKYRTDEGQMWQDEKPEFTEAGEYTVYFKIKDPNNNYKETEDHKKVIITKSKIICYESQQLDVLYDGAQHAASIYVSRPTADKATVLYSNDNGATYTEKEPPRHKDVGTYKQYFKVEAGNNYEEYYGTKTLTISPRSIKRANIETISHRAYTGRPITPSIIITDGTPSIISESDYVVSYSNNVDKGEATATITGINNYTDQVTETFYITDADPTTSDNTGASVSQTNESASGGSADLSGMAGSASSLLTGEDIRPLFVLIVTFLLNLCAALIIFRYKKREHYKGR